MDAVIGICIIAGFLLFVEYRKNSRGKVGPIGKVIGKKLFDVEEDA